MSPGVHPYDVSVVVPFRDDEEVIGTAIAAVASHLRQRDFSFEIIAVDDDSGDNSVPVLALIRAQYPELHLTRTKRRGRGHRVGAERASGRVLWFVEPAAASASLASFDAAYTRVSGGELDVLVAGDGSMLAHRGRALDAIAGVRRHPFARRLVERARRSRLRVATPHRAPAARWTAQLVAGLWLPRAS